MTLKAESFGSHSIIAEEPAYSMAGQLRMRHGLSAVAHRYDTFLIDQWGVLHDGREPYDGVIECLRNLVKSGKQVIILSNSGKRAADNALRLKEIGIPAECYSHLVTSGELAWQFLARGRGRFRKLMDKRCLPLASDDPARLMKGLPVAWAKTVEDADFILLAGIDDSLPQHAYDHIVAAGVAQGIPLICANPDLTRITPQGLKPSSGALAQRYQAMGGNVSHIGKPYRDIYEECLLHAYSNSTGEVLAVGDSLHHDIAGGAAAGIDTLLVMNGVHAGQLPANASPVLLQEAMQEIAGPDGALPDWAIPSFRW